MEEDVQAHREKGGPRGGLRGLPLAVPVPEVPGPRATGHARATSSLRPAGSTESATGYNNRNKKNRNTRWVSDHCGRVHRRCHVHLLDIYNFSRAARPVDDLLVIEMASHNSGRAWRQLADFTFGGGRAARIVPRSARPRGSRRFASFPRCRTRTRGPSGRRS